MRGRTARRARKRRAATAHSALPRRAISGADRRWCRSRGAELSRLWRLNRSPSERGLIEDAEAAYRFALTGAPAERIVPIGESLGAGVAVALAAQHRVGGIVLEAPFTSAADVGPAVYRFLPVRLLMKDPFYSDRRIAKVQAPLLVLHGGRDAVVPITLGERLYGQANGPKRFVRFDEGGHSDPKRARRPGGDPRLAPGIAMNVLALSVPLA
jgi:fermentation-respiration switch protein FrsA (DUF1100 family)